MFFSSHRFNISKMFFQRPVFKNAFLVGMVLAIVGAITAQSGSRQIDAKDPPNNGKPYRIQVAEKHLEFTVPGSWKQVTPRSRMLDSEIKIPRVEGDVSDGRLIIMGAGGTIEANIERWQGQFKDLAAIERRKIAGQEVVLVQLSGTYIDAPGGPFSGRPKIERENYKMLGAIIQSKKAGNYYVKLYGPQATIEKNAKGFEEMIESLQVHE